ncbi:hypothetical protein DY000_02030757 [Brassica cretica]|uniref:Retrotransposon gag domain-containing protein n=1 Tax=Brassica cretica TaxID=69181 RepID=A0ABQ7DUF2_BRACR|nr:hypothetical protein DY000_02030757 [Brassica cretica]
MGGSTHPDAEQDDKPCFGTNSENEEEAISESGRNVKESQLVLAEEEEVESEAGNVTELEAPSTYFSGYGQRDETYLKWEDEMEALFQSHHVPEEEKLSYATKTLTGPALAWWGREEYDQCYYGDPAHTRESFKFEMLEEFVKKGYQTQSHIQKELFNQREKAGVVLESGEPQTKDEAMAQGLQKPPASSTQRTEAKDPIGDPHKEVTRCLGAKVKQEVTTRKFLIPDDPPGHAHPTRMPEQSRGAFMSFPLKEEPPDVPSKIKPIKYQVSRSKLFQGRGYDAAIKSVDEPEANQLHQAANPKTNQDMCSVKMAYLTNQEEVFHETNFNTFYATKGVEPNWNHHQSYSEHKYMNFTNRRFSIPSICEYRSLEVVYSQTKKLSGPKKIMEIKMDLVDFQQAKNEDKNPRKYGVMINFPKPDKSVLHLPYLEAAGSINCKPDIDDQERHLTI